MNGWKQFTMFMFGAACAHLMHNDRRQALWCVGCGVIGGLIYRTIEKAIWDSK